MNLPKSLSAAPRVPAGLNSLASASRRGILGALSAAPALGVFATSAAAAPPIGHSDDPAWAALVADYRTKSAAWLETVDEEAECREALWDASPDKPVNPGSGLPDDISNMTIAEIRRSGSSPNHKAAVAQYERDLAAWNEAQDALAEQIYTPAKDRYDAAYQAYTAALSDLTTYRVTSLNDLGEKIEIVIAEYHGCDVPECLGDILADARHLSKREG